MRMQASISGQDDLPRPPKAAPRAPPVARRAALPVALPSPAARDAAKAARRPAFMPIHRGSRASRARVIRTATPDKVRVSFVVMVERFRSPRFIQVAHELGELLDVVARQIADNEMTGRKINHTIWAFLLGVAFGASVGTFTVATLIWGGALVVS